MNKKWIIASCVVGLLLICGIATALLWPKENPSLPQKLETPTVSLQDDTAQWNANPLAEKFEISLDGVLFYVENSVTSQKLTDGQTFKIRAVGDGTNYTASDWSNTVTYVKAVSTYTVTWKNGDTVLAIDENVEHGTIPTYQGETPQ